MSIVTDPATVSTTEVPPVFDLYRDIHKGIRAELFAVTSLAGTIDPGERNDRIALAEHVASIAATLESHARHEDVVIEPVLQKFRADLAARIADDHERLERAFATITCSATAFVEALPDGARAAARSLYLDLASFTGVYVQHQDLEERVVMPAIEQAIGVDAVIGLNTEIISSIPPDEMARSLAFMLPAMNVDDRAEMLGGMKAGAPAEVFAGVLGLARSVLRPADFDAVACRLGVV